MNDEIRKSPLGEHHSGWFRWESSMDDWFHVQQNMEKFKSKGTCKNCVLVEIVVKANLWTQWIARITLKNKHTSWFQNVYKAMVIQTVQYCHKDRYINHWDRIESPEMYLYIYGQFIINKGAETTEWGKNLFNNWWLDHCISTCNRMKLDLHPTPYSNI